jgi:hypothetical protein
MPITITIAANNADELRQLMQDAASTLAGMRTDDIADVQVSTVESYQPIQPINTTTPQPPAGQATVPPPVAQAPTTPAAPLAQQSAPIAQPAVQQPAPVSQPAAAPTAAPTYDFNQIATATMQLQQAGQNIFELFSQFGIQALNQLPKERYAEYAAVLRQRGAKI